MKGVFRSRERALSSFVTVFAPQARGLGAIRALVGVAGSDAPSRET